MESDGDILLFLGRWHPLLVHLPIGMLIMAFAFALLSRKKNKEVFTPAVSISLLFGSASALIAAVSGYLLSLNGGYDARTLSLHQWLGITVALVSTLCWLLYRRPISEKDVLHPLRKLRFALLTFMLVLLCVAGHFGGTLTHGDGYLVEALPERVRRLTGWQPEQVVIENVQEAAVYADIIQPILKQRCQSCHGAKKQENGLAVHTMEALAQGGEGGQVIAAGNAGESELYRRLILPEGHEERMPPKGRTPISEGQIKLIAWWIDAGAPTDKKVMELEQPEEIQPVLLALASPAASEDIPAADTEAVEKLVAKGVKVIPLAAAKNQLLVNAVNCPQFNDEDSRLLSGLGANITQLKLGDTQITDSALRHIGQLRGLQRLHLENTAVSDKGLDLLNGCKQLRYINLVNTKVTDKGLQALAHLPTLHAVYLYQTGVTTQGIATLAQAMPKLEIDTGNYQLPILSSDTVVYQ
ncbi:DUF2231 domain-containing protein [Parapedobacter tibetensis]|uniref:DUF2231 domain-containing protein n=1 Tax=Parapedobacter tibetensis TaxID=2972951 RepID=UPI00214DA9F5|nr:DUF2231 domain-containing protein [Parapedobacter tibetensis]